MRKRKEPSAASFTSHHGDPRYSLSAGISLHKAARRDEETYRLKANKLREAVERRTSNLHEAREALKHAAVQQATAVHDFVSGGELQDSSNNINIAREGETRANDALMAAKTALEQCETELEEAEYRTSRAQQNLAPLAQAVVIPELPRLLESAKAAHDELICRRLALRTIIRKIDWSLRKAPEAEAAIRLLQNGSLPMTFGYTEYEDWNNHPETIRWEAAIANLLEDAGGALPV